MKLFIVLLIAIILTGCYREEPEQIVTVRDSNWQDKNDPSDQDYLNNRHPFFVEDGYGDIVFFKNERKEDEVD